MQISWPMLFVWVGLSVAGAWTAPTVADTPPDAIEFPTSPTPPAPLPGVSPKLPAGVVFDIRCKSDCVVRAYPASLVTVTKDVVGAGETLRVKDTFSDGATQHVYRGPLTVYSIRAAGTGSCDVVVIPVGFKAESEIKSVTLDVDAGQGPQPPPEDSFSKSLQQAFNAEPATYTDAAGKVWSKADCVSKLAALYGTAAKSTVQDPAVKTYGDLLKDMKAASVIMLPEAAIPGVRKVVGGRLNDALGVVPGDAPSLNRPLDRTKTASDFVSISNSLKKVK